MLDANVIRQVGWTFLCMYLTFHGYGEFLRVVSIWGFAERARGGSHPII